MRSETEIEIMDNDIGDSYKFARLAVDKAKLCSVNATSQNPPPRVGIVLEKNGVMLGWAAKGHNGVYVIDGVEHSFKILKHEHAEQALLSKLHFSDLTGATAYITLEPCTKRKKGESCASCWLLVELQSFMLEIVIRTQTLVLWHGASFISMALPSKISLVIFEMKRVVTMRHFSPNFTCRARKLEAHLLTTNPTVDCAYSGVLGVNFKRDGQTVGRDQFMP